MGEKLNIIQECETCFYKGLNWGIDSLSRMPAGYWRYLISCPQCAAPRFFDDKRNEVN